MPVQAQQKQKSFMEEERERFEEHAAFREKTKSSKPNGRRSLSVPAIVAGCVICVLCAFGGAYMRETSTLFVKDRPAEGYLPVQEFMLVDGETGKEVQHVKDLQFRDAHAFYGDDSGLITSRGLKTGDSWETFVEAYGDETASSVYITPTDENGDYDYSNSTYITDEMTVKEFDDAYVKTGRVNPRNDEISVTFTAYTDGYTVFYGEKERSRFVSRYYRKNWLSHPLTDHADYGEYEMEFSFSPDTESAFTHNGLQYISTTY